MDKEVLGEGIDAFETAADEVLKDEEIPVNRKVKFAKKVDNGLRTLREAVQVLED